MATKLVTASKEVNLLEFRTEIWHVIINQVQHKGTPFYMADFSLDIELLTHKIKERLRLESVEPSEVVVAVKEIFENLIISTSVAGLKNHLIVTTMTPKLPIATNDRAEQSGIQERSLVEAPLISCEQTYCA